MCRYTYTPLIKQLLYKNKVPVDLIGAESGRPNLSTIFGRFFLHGVDGKLTVQSLGLHYKYSNLSLLFFVRSSTQLVQPPVGYTQAKGIL